MRTLQIGIMGSASDLNYSQELENRAKEMGFLIAQSGNVLMYGAEKDYDSLSTAAARSCSEAGGITVGVTYGTNKETFDAESSTICIVSGLGRGGGREFALVASCDVIITLNGGSGTLTEIAQAYQLDIPIIALSGTGGWSEKLAGTYLDERKRRIILVATTPVEAVKLAINAAKAKLNKKKTNKEVK